MDYTAMQCSSLTNKRMRRVYLGLGTNLGDKKKNIMQAIEELSLALGCIPKTSPIIETEAWGFSSPNSFINCVVEYSTSLNPHDLLAVTEFIERNMGRTNKSTDSGYCDRIIDIDILLYEDAVIATPALTIPHPLMHKRRFVLEPLLQIAPELVHPVLGKSMKELLDELSKEEGTAY